MEIKVYNPSWEYPTIDSGLGSYEKTAAAWF